MSILTPEKREALEAELKALDEADMQIAKIMKPYIAALRHIEAARDLVLERYGLPTGPVGACEVCSRNLFDGEQAHLCADGPMLCVEHAPTYADLKHQAEGGHAQCEEDEATNADKLRAIEAHLAKGGQLTDKIVHPL